MKYQWMVAWTLVLFAFCALAQPGVYHEERKFYEQSCHTCHEMKFYLWSRSHKSWELTVTRMRGYINDDTVLSVDGSQRITDFLAAYVDEGRIIVPEGVIYDSSERDQAELTVQGASLPLAEVESAVQPAMVAVEAVPVAEVVERVVVPEPESVNNVAVVVATVPIKQPPRSSKARTIDLNPLKRLWNPGRSALTVARCSGFLAMISLLALLASGFGRRKLKLRFRSLHAKLALVLFLALSTHGAIYLFEYGSPGVLWYWFGFVAFSLLIVTELQGIVRKRFRKGLLISHIIGACTGLALSVLHWVWAWL